MTGLQHWHRYDNHLFTGQDQCIHWVGSSWHRHLVGMPRTVHNWLTTLAPPLRETMFYELSAFDPTDLTFNPMWCQGSMYWHRLRHLFTGQDINTFTLLFFVSSLVTASDTLCMVGLLQLGLLTGSPLLRVLLSADGLRTSPVLYCSGSSVAYVVTDRYAVLLVTSHLSPENTLNRN
jgi:hypothetical protein